MITLHSYQDKVIKFMENVEKDHKAGGMLCLDMGLGKTFTSLGLIFRNINKTKTTLIIVPKTLLHNWEVEYEKYRVGREEIEVSFAVYYKNIGDFTENIILTTYETIKRNHRFLQLQFDRIILDESQNIRNRRCQITQQIVQLKGYKRWCLSGTPFFNNYHDLSSQCKFINILPFSDRKNWKNPTELFLKDFRSNFCYILKKEDVLVGENKLPKIFHHKVTPKLNDTEKAIYQQFKNFLNEGGNTLNYLIKIRQTCCNVKVMTKKEYSCCVCTQRTHIKYSCDHYVCSECYPKRRNRKKKCHICKIDSTKFDSILDIYEESEEEDKIVIFTQWKTMAVLLKKYLKKQHIKSHIIHGAVSIDDRNNIIENFKTDDRRVLIATIQTCGVGINLTSANHVILLDSWWNSSLENQAIDRLYRIGQNKEVHVYHITIENTIERWIDFKQRQKKIQTRILLEKDNKDYRWLGESYGIYTTKKVSDNMRRRRFINAKSMSTLSLNSCLGRDFVRSYDKELWSARNDAANVIQNFFKKYVGGNKKEVKEILDKKFYEDISQLVFDYTFFTKPIKL